MSAGIADGNTAVITFTRPVQADTPRSADSYDAAKLKINPLASGASFAGTTYPRWYRTGIQCTAIPIVTTAFADNDLNARTIINQVLTGNTAGCAPFNTATGVDLTGQATLTKNGSLPVYTACAHMLQYSIPASAPAYRSIRFTVPADLDDAVCKVIFLRDLTVVYSTADVAFPATIADPLGATADVSTDPKKEGWLNRFAAVCTGQQPAAGFEKIGEVAVGPEDAGMSIDCPISLSPNASGVIWMVVTVQATVGAGPFSGSWSFGSTAWSADGLALVC